MNDPTLDPIYFEQIEPTFLKLFRKFVNPDYVIHIFKQKKFLTDIDLSKIEACTKNEGKITGSLLLFERLTLYEGWYSCLLDVLQDSDVKLSHVAREMQEIRGIVDQNFQEDEQDLCALCMPVITSGMISLQHFSTISSRLNSSKVHKILLRRLVKLKVKLELVQNELDEIKRRLGEEENNAQIASDTVILPVESTPVDPVYCSDCKKMLQMKDELQAEFEKLKEKCYAYKKSRKTFDQENGILQTKLDVLKKEISDSKSSFEKLSMEKDILQTQYDHLIVENLETKSSFEKLSKEKDILQTEFDRLKTDNSDTNSFLEHLTNEKDKLQMQFDLLKKENSDTISSFEMLSKEKEILQTELDRLKKDNSDTKASFENLSKEKDIQQNEFGRLKKEKPDTKSTFENLSKEKDILKTEFDHLIKENSDAKSTFVKLSKEEDILIEFDPLKKGNSDSKLSSGKLYNVEDEMVTRVKSTSSDLQPYTYGDLSHGAVKELACVDLEYDKSIERSDFSLAADHTTKEAKSGIRPVFLLVGRTGNGKSSVMNALLGEARFQVSRGDSPDDHEIKWAENENIKVVDGSRIGDTGEDMPGGVEASIRRADEAFDLCGGGFNALLFCLRYGVRLTKQEKDAVQLVKALFGDGVFRECGIIVVSRDNFEQGGGETFKGWLGRPQELNELITDFCGRCFLLNDIKQNMEQRKEIIAKANKLKKYTEEKFIAAKGSRQQLIQRVQVKPKNSGLLLEHRTNHSHTKAANTKTKESYTRDNHQAKVLGKEKMQLFVVGMDGNGKSSTTRTIVGDNNNVVFTSGPINVMSNDDFLVADGAGVGEPLEDSELLDTNFEETLDRVDRVMCQFFKNSLTAIVFVLKFGCRYTSQNREYLQIIKDIFGQDVIRRRGVVVLTFGDIFYKCVEGTFHNWCLEPAGDFKSLIEECNYRCMLFNNRDGTKRESQVNDFKAAVAQIDATIPYVYKPDKNSRKKLINKHKYYKYLKHKYRH